VHRFQLRKTDGFSCGPFNPGREIQVFAFDLMPVGFKMALINRLGNLIFGALPIAPEVWLLFLEELRKFAVVRLMP
jgi:hypothetical protein